MKRNRYDVLPIQNEDGTYTEYFSTVKWGEYENLNILKIKNANSIYFRFCLKDLVREFKITENHYYFLTDGDEPLGLVSYVNLNCQLVYNYLFFVFSDIERSVSDVLKKHITGLDVIAYFLNSQDKHSQEIIKTYEESILSNNDSDIFQLLYLQDLGTIIGKFFEILPKNLKSLKKYSTKFGTNSVYRKLRNRIMHPVRLILSDNESIHQINELLSDYQEIKRILISTN
jgi:hypothetical protein